MKIRKEIIVFVHCNETGKSKWNKQVITVAKIDSSIQKFENIKEEALQSQHNKKVFYCKEMFTHF